MLRGDRQGVHLHRANDLVLAVQEQDRNGSHLHRDLADAVAAAKGLVEDLGVGVHHREVLVLGGGENQLAGLGPVLIVARAVVENLRGRELVIDAGKPCRRDRGRVLAADHRGVAEHTGQLLDLSDDGRSRALDLLLGLLGQRLGATDHRLAIRDENQTPHCIAGNVHENLLSYNFNPLRHSLRVSMDKTSLSC